MARRILGHAFLHARKLFRGGFRLILGLPFSRRHAVDQGTRLFLRKLRLRLHHPVGKAVAAKTCETHQVDILGIMAVLQMRDQPPECRRRCHITDLLVCLHSYAPFA